MAPVPSAATVGATAGGSAVGAGVVGLVVGTVPPLQAVPFSVNAVGAGLPPAAVNPPVRC
ncbi:hypothetical protein Q0Z83_021280 [Actinoplanes sichuanensis]|nr:hypothetical protein Q0Z83_021280 [Actinoplanes sichuanensis]